VARIVSSIGIKRLIRRSIIARPDALIVSRPAILTHATVRDNLAIPTEKRRRCSDTMPEHLLTIGFN